MQAMEESAARIGQLLRGRTRELRDRTYAPGKWTTSQLLAHLAQAEIVFGNRLRFGATTDGYVVQPFDQDEWIKVDVDVDPVVALDAYLALRALNDKVTRDPRVSSSLVPIGDGLLLARKR